MKWMMCRLLLAVALMSGPCVGYAEAQQKHDARRIGFLSVYSESDLPSQRWHESFRRALRDRGWEVGQNLTIVYRWVRGTPLCKEAGRRACVPVLVDQLLDLDVEVIVVHGGFPARAVQAKNDKIPVVMAEASDAVGRGVVKSLAYPGGNITGLTSITPVLAEKRLALLKEVLPDLSHVAVMWTPEAPASIYGWEQIPSSAEKLGLKLHSLKLERSDDLDKRFEESVGSGAEAIISTSGVSSTFGHKRIVELVAKTELPAIFTDEAVVALGGLMSYNRDTEDLYRRAASFTDKILRGTKPGDLPIEQPTKFNLVVNLKAAKAIGIELPMTILLRADEVIE